MDNNENKRFEDYSDPRVTNLNGQPYHSASENDGKPFSERGYESAAPSDTIPALRPPRPHPHRD